MTLKLVHKLKERGYSLNEIINHIQNTPLNERETALKQKQNPKHIEKLVFVTRYTDDVYRIKRIFKKALDTE